MAITYSYLIETNSKALSEVDSEIARIRECIERGTVSQTARVELVELLDRRARIVESIVQGGKSEKGGEGVKNI